MCYTRSFLSSRYAKGKCICRYGNSKCCGTFIIGAIAKFQMVLAPGRRLNAFFAFGGCMGMGVPWQSAISATLLSGIIFLIISVTGIREVVIKSIPNDI